MALSTPKTHSKPPQSDAEESPITLDEAVPTCVEYLASYRSYSPSTVGTYRRDLHLLREFLSGGNGHLPPPSEITRHQVIQFAVSLSGKAPLTVRRKLACLCSFFGFLQDMGCATRNPARRLPLPKVSEPAQTCVARNTKTGSSAHGTKDRGCSAPKQPSMVRLRCHVTPLNSLSPLPRGVGQIGPSLLPHSGMCAGAVSGHDSAPRRQRVP